MMLWSNNRIRFVLTGECNINCFYCHNEGQPKSVNYFSSSLYSNILELLTELREPLSSVTFTGGEPLLHPNLEKFISNVSTFTKSSTLVTNGLLLTQEKILSLKSSGLTKIRLGVDSIIRETSRPTIGKKSEKSILGIIELLLNNSVDFEINTVITKFNENEIASIIQFCEKNQISAKFFEMVNVGNHGSEVIAANMNSNAQVPFDKFQKIAISSIKNCVHYPDKNMQGANYIFKGNHFEIRYCKYLCDFKLCYKTGTRIDSDGAVYVCMSQRGKIKIDENDNCENLKLKIAKAVSDGCIIK